MTQSRLSPMLAGTPLRPGVAEDAFFRPQYGFLELTPEQGTDLRRFVGFVATHGELGPQHDAIHSVTELHDLPAHRQNIKELGKGAGVRLYNTAEAAQGFPGRMDGYAAYEVALDPARILDLRNSQGSWITRVARHAGRVLQSKIRGLEETVDDIHAKYTNFDAVLMTQPPRAAVRQRLQRGAKSSVPEALLIIRNPNIILRRVDALTSTDSAESQA